jgi:hydroxypyruvate isomerase
MLKFSLCIEPLASLDFYDRIKLAADQGFEAFEFWDPTGRDPQRIASLAAQNHITAASCLSIDSWGKSMSAPAEIVLPSMRESISVAKDMGCQAVIVLSGLREGDPSAQMRIQVDNLKRVGDLAVQEGITILYEGANSLVDHPGYFLDSSALGFEIIRQVGCERVKFLYDIYHMQIMEGNIIATVTGNINLIGHFHSAAVPGRHEHFYGELNYPEILKAIAKTTFDGYFGLEYWPTIEPAESVAITRRYLKSGLEGWV